MFSGAAAVLCSHTAEVPWPYERVVRLLLSAEHTVYFSVTQLVLNPWFLPLAREIT